MSISNRAIDENDIAGWLSVTQFVEKYTLFKKNTLRELIRYRHKNGFDVCSKVVNKRALVHEIRVERWMDEHADKPKKIA